MLRSLLSFICVFLGCADTAPTAPTGATGAAVQAVRTVDVATLKADMDRGAVPLLVDVRTAGEYGGGHVPGAKNVPLDQLSARVAEFGVPGSEVYVICQSGGRSAKAGAELAAKGLRPVNVSGGTGGWRAAGYPVE